MINALELENFKAFGRRQRIEFAPITLILGENSAGKTSILQALNLLKQTRESREHGALLLPRADNDIVNLGSFSELLYDHDHDRELSIRVDLTPSHPRQMRSMFDEDELNREVGYEMKFSLRQPEMDVQLNHLAVFAQTGEAVAAFQPRSLGGEEKRMLRQNPVFWRSQRSIKSSQMFGAQCISVTDEAFSWTRMHKTCSEFSAEIIKSLERFKEEATGRRTTAEQKSLFEEDNQFAETVDSAIKFYASEFSTEDLATRFKEAQIGLVVGLDGFIAIPGQTHRQMALPEIHALRLHSSQRSMRGIFGMDVGTLLFEAGRLLEDGLERLFPMGPFRRPPERWYIFTGTSPQDVGYRGDLLPDLLYRRDTLLAETNEWLDRLEIGYHIEVRSVGTRSNDLFELRLVDKRRSTAVDVALSDVGFGISQLLPFIVQSLASESQIITIEQPEVHVHPRLQADIGDLIAEAIQEPRGHRFIIETHSEHLVLRMQKLIRDGKLKPEDVSVLYVKRGSEGSDVSRLRLDEDGDFMDEWPGGFFPERSRELR